MPNYKLLVTLILCAACAVACGESDDNSSDTFATIALLAAANPGEVDIPQPADDSATLILDGASQSLTDVLGCADGAAGISVRAGGNPPVLSILKTTFAAGSVVLNNQVNFAGDNNILILDLPEGGAGRDPVSTCETKIFENSTVYDIQALNCQLRTPPASAVSNTISFRLRCIKD